MPEVVGRLVLPDLSAAPSSPKVGEIYFDTAFNTAYVWNGTLWIPMRGASTAGALPGSPFDGQEILYLADATNGIYWHFRYRAASASTYKWEFLGGSPLHSSVATDETFTIGASYADCATVGPSVTIPLAGDYRYDFSANLYSSGQTTASTFTAGLFAGGAPGGPQLGSAYSVSGIGVTCAKSGILASEPLGRLYKVQYNIPTAAGGTPHARWRTLMMTPVRVG